MTVPNKLNISKEEQEDIHEKEDLTWENPSDPENASDIRDVEQLQRQRKEAEASKDNSSDNSSK
ncbi:hypothetical protein [Arcticibacter eurypsychrophilus]|uniref:hypothetical protein n=1 Tax=Arcticibacter eurypsychrophilus TaxID=1434752 RepID=UPI00084DDAFF|nr:hypothetical protein [Arcticibacter eurypsychrophilus]